MKTAGQMYERAMATQYRNPELYYKLGYINYTGGEEENYQKALLNFYQIASQYSSNSNLLFSIANTLYNRSDYFAAQGYYNRLLDILEEQRSRYPLLRPHEEPEQMSLVEMIMRTYNNLGVTLKRQSESRRDPQKETEALVTLTRSSEYFDIINRDPDSMRRGETKNLAYLNTRGILYPQSDFIPQIYSRIPKDIAAAQF